MAYAEMNVAQSQSVALDAIPVSESRFHSAIMDRPMNLIDAEGED